MPSPEPTAPEFLSRSADRIAPDGSPFRAMVLEILAEEYRRTPPPDAPAEASGDAERLDADEMLMIAVLCDLYRGPGYQAIGEKARRIAAVLRAEAEKIEKGEA